MFTSLGIENVIRLFPFSARWLLFWGEGGKNESYKILVANFNYRIK